MVDYFDTAQMSSALSNLTARVTGKAGEVSLYPLLKKATSSTDQPTPGYIYQVFRDFCFCSNLTPPQILVEFSFESPENSRHLAKYLNMRLQRPSAHGVLKTLKSMKQLVEKGSREFRKALRENDEHIKNAPDYSSQQGSFLGTDVHEQATTLSRQILKDLFDQDTIERDNSKEAEVRRLQSSTMAGMGRSTGSSQGRLEGFGSEPVDKSSMMDKARDMLESVVNLPDPKKQIMELCLKDDVGSYEAVHLPGLPPVKGRRLVGGLPLPEKDPPKAHTPGRAGGGWEDSSDEEQTRIEQFTNTSSDVAPEVPRESSLALSEEAKIVKNFCDEKEKDLIVDKCQEAVGRLTENDPMTGLFCLIEVLESSSPDSHFRALLLLEFLLAQGSPSHSAVATVYKRVLPKLELSHEHRVAVKAKKINAILEALKKEGEK